MWKISEGDIKFLYVMRLVPSQDLGSYVHINTLSLKLLIIVALSTEKY